MIINELRHQIPYSILLELIDWCPYEVERRGKEPVPFLAEHITITSCFTPEQMFPNLAQTDNIDQLLRRVKVHKIERAEEKVVKIPKPNIIKLPWNQTLLQAMQQAETGSTQ